MSMKVFIYSYAHTYVCMCTVCISTFEYTFANLTAESSSWPWGHIFQPNERGRTEVACEYAVSVCVHLGYCSYVRTYVQ